MQDSPDIAALEAELKLFSAVSSDTVYRLRYATMEYDYVSPSCERLLGYTADELRGMNIRALILETRMVANDMRPVDSFAPLEAQRRRGEVNKWQADYRMKCKDGQQIWVSDISFPWFDENGAIIGSVGTLRDITERVRAEAKSREEGLRAATIDPLTGLLSRRAFLARLEEEVKRLKRSEADLSLLLIDIDGFGTINTDHGAKTGDLVIQGIARIIGNCLRETDIGARTDGGAFGVLLPETPVGGAFWVAERIRQSVAEHIFTFDTDEHLMGCTVSIGVSSARDLPHADASRLYTQADSRLFIAKHTGRNQVSLDEVMEVH